MSFKKSIGSLLRKILSERIYSLVANGFIIVPSFYKSIIKDADKYFRYSLKESPEKDVLLMRKYAHIIDKGLHRKDVSPGHSMVYYQLLKETLNKLSVTPYKDDPTYKWAQSKIKLYESLQQSPETFTPLEGLNPSVQAVDYEDFVKLVQSRRSNRFFLEKKITDDVAFKLVSVSNWASSSCNKQPVKLFYTLNPELASECLKCCKGGTGFSPFIPSFWVFAADSRGYVWPSEMMLPYIDVSLGAQNVYLAAQTLGITGTVLSWAQKSEEEDTQLRKLLSIPDEYVIVFCSVMGYASSTYMTPVRKY